jgi:hypothetical protein
VIDGSMPALRIRDGASAALLWQYDTTREQATVSGETGKGGSIGGARGR